MAAFQVGRTDCDGEAAITVASPDHRVRAVLALRGDADQLADPRGRRTAGSHRRLPRPSRTGRAARGAGRHPGPLPQRLTHGRYRFDGHEHDLLPGV